MFWDPTFHPWLIAGIGAVAVVVALWREFREERRALRPGWFHVACLALRLAVIGCIVVLLFNPSQRVAGERASERSLVLLDTSASMNLAGDEKGRSRLDLAGEYLNEWLGEMAKRGLPEPVVREFPGEGARGTEMGTALGRGFIGSGRELPTQVVILSDGQVHDRSLLGEALGMAGSRGVPVSTKLFGIDSPPLNARIEEIEAPSLVRPGAEVSINVSLSGSGFKNSEQVKLQLFDEEGETLVEEMFYFDPPQDEAGKLKARRTVTFSAGLRSSRYSVAVSLNGREEVDVVDNRFSFPIEVSTGKLRVLYAEGTHEKRPVGSGGHWWNNMEHITRGWDESGDIEYVCLTTVDNRNRFPNLVGVTFPNGEMRLDKSVTFPQTREELHQFDVIMICGIQRLNFSEEQMQWVVDWVVERGGGFLMGGGTNSFDAGEYDETLWERIIPVDIMAFGDGVWREPFTVRIPPTVRNHPIWTIGEPGAENDAILATVPAFDGMNRIRRAKPGAQILAMREGSDEPVMAAQRYGRGRSIAFLPDPNGAWGREFLTWGPPGLPHVGESVVMGQGPDFRFSETAAEIPPGPSPINPCPWYGRFWANSIQWLGQNSVRWRTDDLSGKILDARAEPGGELSVAAEIFSVFDIDELQRLDVGARVELPGERRQRLEFNQDLREFRGEIAVPSDLGDKEEVRVLFDVTVGDESVSQRRTIGIYRGNPEFADTAPDSVLMEDIAKTTGGVSLGDVSSLMRETVRLYEEQERVERIGKNVPLWNRWPIMGLIAAFLFLEWFLRRRGAKAFVGDSSASGRAASEGAKAAVVLILLFGLSPIVTADSSKMLSDWIGDLGSDRVRIRDEAEAHLLTQFEGRAAIHLAAETAESEEVRIRAKRIYQLLMQNFRWELVATRQGHTQNVGVMNRAAVTTASGEFFLTRGRDFVRVWNSETIEPRIKVGDRVFEVDDPFLREGLVSTLAVDPEGKRVVSSNDRSEIIVHDLVTGAELQRFHHPRANGAIRGQRPYLNGILFDISFLDDDTIVTGERSWVRCWSLSTEKEKWAVNIVGAAVALAVEPGGKRILISADRPGPLGAILSLNAENGETVQDLSGRYDITQMRFDATGKRLLASSRDGFARIFAYDSEEGKLSDETHFGPVSGECFDAVWGPDETTVIVSSNDADQALTEFSVVAGEKLWQSPPGTVGLREMAVIPGRRVVANGEDGLITVWQFFEP